MTTLARARLATIPVTLTWMELFEAAVVGVTRHIKALQDHRPDRHGLEGDGWTCHVEGAAGELAFSKGCQRYWRMSINTFRTCPDVGVYEVRTRSRPDYQLIVRQDDSDTAPFVLVRGKSPKFEIVGWMLGADAKRPEWRKTYGGREAAYFVPDEHLRPLTELGTP